ncbi:DNA gyrase subunit A [Subdoligranulum variabile]|uniref:DNA gyrase subunit A n=1 Tax=Subdoligranulum variabile DSM 15176 TaxID=411471 RepID=D1PRM5_9FIRM|nr:DNA gyrase subunit A [Subdoligranulum variabile]EFB74642.1 DNA gyrase, A subunit [Subdoligranulum variabile DSM 15176]UWP69614.1 DNA gyrase subunit A [Subdoligranulum variabile]
MEENIIMVPGSGTKVIERDVKQEIETAFLDYSMSVIVSRALPDVRDGLKPVHRRILYTMHERGNDPQHPYRKSADTVGAVLGSYHPHGDASVYDAMVRLAQDFSLRYPLVDGQGNFGSVDGDPPAAYRYTEARMSKIACEMLTDIEKDTIDWDPNFDETKKEPHVLPSRFPNLLVNGSQGIAVGMATNIPPHNLREVVAGMCALMDNPDIDLAGLMEFVKGPDFPTGGIIMGRSGIRAAYATGRGKITLRGRAEIVEKKNGRYEILITEIPYMVNKTRLIESIADLVKDKRIEGISDLNDESSSRTGMKIVIEIKKDANPQVVLNQLYRYTQLQDTVGVIMLALDDGVPKIMSLKTVMERYIDFQMEVIRRRTAFDLKKAQEREHILEGLRKAVDIVDEIIATIRACKGGFAEARQAVMDNFGFDELQADAIVKLQLGRLAGLEILKIEQELGELREAIADYKDILSNDEHVKRIVKTDLQTLADKYGDERRTSIEAVSGEVDIEDLIPEETCIFTLTHEGYIKRTTLDTYQAQNRGGRGVQGMTQKDDDFTEELFVGSTHDYMLFMTDQGRVYRLKGYQVPEGSRTAKGSHIVNLLQLQEGEKVTLMLQQSAKADEDNTYLTMVTRQGLIKRTPLSQFRNIRKAGLIAIGLNEGDSLVWSHLTGGGDEIIVATHDGAAIHFTESGARAMGRTGHGVRVIRLREGDYVIGAGVCRPGATVLTITEDGKGRRSRVDDYRITKRGGLGIRNYAKGGVAGIKIVDETDDLILISANGILIRLHASDINVQSRYGSGVRVMRLGEGDKVAMVARVDRDNEAETAKVEADAGDESEPSAEELAAIEAAERADEAADVPDDE